MCNYSVETGSAFGRLIDETTTTIRLYNGIAQASMFVHYISRSWIRFRCCIISRRPPKYSGMLEVALAL